MRWLSVLFLLFQMVEIWLGGLFTPEAYITATRQYVAQANNWSLEELYLDVRTQLKYISVFIIARLAMVVRYMLFFLLED